MMSIRQFTMWIIMYQVGSALLIIPAALASAARQDAWLSVIVACLLEKLCIFLLYIPIAKQMKGSSLLQHLEGLIGSLFARIGLQFFILAFPFLIFVMTLRNMGDFISTVVLIGTPIDVIHLLILVTVLYGLWTGLSAVARSAETLFPVTIFLLGLLIVSLLQAVKLYNLRPVLEFGFLPVIRGALPLWAFPFMEIPLFLFLLPFLQDAKNWGKAIVRSSLFSCFIYLVVIVIVLTVLTPELTANLVLPSYFVVRTVSIAGFFERFEVFLAIVWMITIFFRLALLLFITVKGTSEVMRLRHSNLLLIPFALAALALADIIWPSGTYLLDLFQIWPSYAAIMGIILPLFMFAAGKLKEIR